MSQTCDGFRGFVSAGPSTYDPDGEHYAQVPLSIFGALTFCEQKVFKAYLWAWDGKTQTNATYKDMMPEADLGRRRFAEGKRRLRERGIIDSIRQGGRCVVTYLKRLVSRETNPKDQPRPRPEKAKPLAEQGRKTEADITAQRLIYNFEAYGWRLERDGDKVKLVKTRDDATDPPPEVRRQAIAYKSAILKLIDAQRPQRE